MKKLISLVVLLLFSASLQRAAAQEALLRASTLPAARPGASGLLDTTVPESLLFKAAGQPDVVIPYAKITEIGRSDEVTYHLGFFPALVVELFMPRQRTHLINIAYTDNSGALQVLSFEVGKNVPETITPVLEGRARNACERRSEFGFCAPIVSLPRRPLTP